MKSLELSPNADVPISEPQGNGQSLEYIDQAMEFVPSIKELKRRKEIARKLIHTVEKLSSALEAEIKIKVAEPDLGKAGLNLSGIIYRMKDQIWNLFHVRNPKNSYMSHSRLKQEEYSITKEFLQTLKKFNQQIRYVEKTFHIKIGEFEHYYIGGIDEAKKISSGRLLTHGAPTDAMYKILERGDLSSVIEQEKKHKTTDRTHIFFGREHLAQHERHSVSFEIDRVYKNFSTDKTKIGTPYNSKLRADIILIFSESHVLDKRQYADADGRHVFDENYIGDTTKSPGLSIDLLETPFMILVSETEKDKLIDFLKEKSAFRDQLALLSSQEFRDWINDHLIIAPQIDHFQFTPEVKAKFFTSTKLRPKKGHVELTDTEAGFKVMSETTKQFIASAA